MLIRKLRQKNNNLNKTTLFVDEPGFYLNCLFNRDKFP